MKKNSTVLTIVVVAVLIVIFAVIAGIYQNSQPDLVFQKKLEKIYKIAADADGDKVMKSGAVDVDLRGVQSGPNAEVNGALDQMFAGETRYLTTLTERDGALFVDMYYPGQWNAGTEESNPGVNYMRYSVAEQSIVDGNTYMNSLVADGEDGESLYQLMPPLPVVTMDDLEEALNSATEEQQENLTVYRYKAA